MVDVFGQDLFIGDEVAFNDHHYTCYLCRGHIIKFTEKKIVIQYDGKKYLKYPVQIVKNIGKII